MEWLSWIKQNPSWTLKAVLITIIVIVIVAVAIKVFKEFQHSHRRKEAHENISNDVPTDQEITLLLYYSDNCGYCTKSKPEWNAFCKQYHESDTNTLAGRRVRCQTINCTNHSVDQNVRVKMDQHQVQRFPQVVLVNGVGPGYVLYDGALKKGLLETFVTKTAKG